MPLNCVQRPAIRVLIVIQGEAMQPQGEFSDFNCAQVKLIVPSKRILTPHS